MSCIQLKRFFCCLLFSAALPSVLATEQLQLLQSKEATSSLLHHGQQEQLLLAKQRLRNSQARSIPPAVKRGAWQTIKEGVESFVDAFNVVRILESQKTILALREQLGDEQTLGASLEDAVTAELRKLADRARMRKVFIDYICDEHFPKFCREERQELVDRLRRFLPNEAFTNEDALKQSIRDSAEVLARDLFKKHYEPLNRTFVKDLEAKVNKLKRKYCDKKGKFKIDWKQRLFGWAPKIKRTYKVKYGKFLPYLTYEEEVTEEAWEELAMLQNSYTTATDGKKFWVGFWKVIDGIKNSIKSLWPFEIVLEDSLQNDAITSDVFENVAATVFKTGLKIAMVYGIWKLVENGIPQVAKDVAAPALQLVTTTGLGCLAAVFGGGGGAGFGAYKAADYLGFAPRDCRAIGILVGLSVTIGTLVAMKYWKPQPKIYKETMEAAKALGGILSAIVVFIIAPTVTLLVFKILYEELGIHYLDAIPWSIWVFWVVYRITRRYRADKKTVQQKKNVRVKKKEKQQEKVMDQPLADESEANEIEEVPLAYVEEIDQEAVDKMAKAVYRAVRDGSKKKRRAQQTIKTN